MNALHHCCIYSTGSYRAKMGRKFFVGGNWKMNGTKAEIDTICSWLAAGPLDPNCEVIQLNFVFLKLRSKIVYSHSITLTQGGGRRAWLLSAVCGGQIAKDCWRCCTELLQGGQGSLHWRIGSSYDSGALIHNLMTRVWFKPKSQPPPRPP